MIILITILFFIIAGVLVYFYNRMINIDLKFLERKIELSNTRTDSLLNAIDRTQVAVNEIKKYLLL